MPHPRILASLLTGLAALACTITVNAGTNAWTFHGPLGGGGRGTAVAVHPTNSSIVMLGTPRGINRSINGGNNWTLVKNDTFAAPTEIAFDPGTPSRVIATDGLLLYLSVDTGVTFTRLQAPATGNVAKIAFGPTGKLYVGLDTGRLYKAASPYANWTDITGGWAANSLPGAITVDPANAAVIYLGIGDSGLYRSDDDGANWSGPLTNGFTPGFIRVNHIAVNPVDSNWIVAATYQSTFVSQNKGATWNRGSDNFATFWVGFDPVTPNAMAALRGYEVMRSTDNGLTWSVVMNLRAASMTRASFVPGAMGRLLLANSNGLAITNYNLNSVSYGLGGLTGVEVRQLTASNDGTIYAAMSSGNADVFKRSGSEFLPLDYLQTLPATTLPRQFTSIAVFPGDSQRIFAVNNYVELIRTFDGGAHWTSAHPAFSPLSADFTTDIAFDPGNAAVAYVSRAPSGIWKTTDSGDNFALIAGSPQSANGVAVSPFNSQVVYAAAAPDNEFGLYKSTDGGQTWVQQLAPSSARKYFRSFAFHPVQPNTVYANSATISYQTTNGGATWTPIAFPGLGSAPIEGMFFDPLIPTTMVAISSAPGFFRSVDGGASWKATYLSEVGNNPASVWAGTIDPADAAVVIVGTNNAGIGEYRVSPDLALAMTPLSTPLPVGATVSTAFTVTNSGPHDSSASEVRIDVPSWITPSGPGCTRTGQTLRCAFGAIKVGESRGVQVAFAVDASAHGSGQIDATLTGHEADSQTANNIAAQSVSASEQANLALGLAVSRVTLDPGESMTLTMSVANQGPSPSTQTTLDLPIPAGIEVTGHTTTHGSCAVTSGTFHCELGTVPVGLSWIVTVDLLATTPGTRDIVAHADGAGADGDVLHTNHFVLRVLPIGDLSVALAESADPVNVGEDFVHGCGEEPLR